LIIGIETSLRARLSFFQLLGWLVGRSVCHNFIKGRKVSLPMKEQNEKITQKVPNFDCEFYDYL